MTTCPPPHRTVPDLPISDLDYELPEELIATSPSDPRDAARMLVISRRNDVLTHRRVRDLPDLLARGDCLVFNRTRVLPARFTGRRVDTGGRVEGLFLGVLDGGDWEVLLRSNGTLRPGIEVDLDHGSGPARLALRRRTGGHWQVRCSDPRSPAAFLAGGGLTPIPPYILRRRSACGQQVEDARDRTWYQTVYAEGGEGHSVAAPTAGLHFTDDLLGELDARGVVRHEISLGIGAGTFLPITADTLSGHEIHSESYHVPVATLDRLRERASGAGGRVIAVGTTTTRCLESLPRDLSTVEGDLAADTSLLISPPWQFQHIDGLLTNFHLPRSTLLALVAAMIGLRRTHEVYREAIHLGYRFYSYGDAMCILP